MRIHAFAAIILFPLQSFAQTPTIARIQGDFVQVKKTISGATRSVPPHFFYKIEGFDYLIKFEIYQPDSTSSLGSSFGIVCFVPDGAIWKFPLVPSNLIRTSTQVFEYSFPLEIQVEGTYRFFIASNNELNSNRHPKFYQYVSNTLSTYLATPSQ